MKRYLYGLLALALVVIGSGVLAACSKDSKGFNDADVTFTQGMIPHHSQAVEMAKLVSSRASSTAIKDLASRIEEAQAPEIEKMRSWLKDWGKKEAVTTMTGMDHGGSSMNGGMMTDTEMTELKAAGGTEFDKMFLTMMTAHHKGAIAQAKAELKDGKNADAKQLAQAIVKAQESEITEMAGLLKSL